MFSYNLWGPYLGVASLCAPFWEGLDVKVSRVNLLQK